MTRRLILTVLALFALSTTATLTACGSGGEPAKADSPDKKDEGGAKEEKKDDGAKAEDKKEEKKDDGDEGGW